MTIYKLKIHDYESANYGKCKLEQSLFEVVFKFSLNKLITSVLKNLHECFNNKAISMINKHDPCSKTQFSWTKKIQEVFSAADFTRCWSSEVGSAAYSKLVSASSPRLYKWFMASRAARLRLEYRMQIKGGVSPFLFLARISAARRISRRWTRFRRSLDMMRCGGIFASAWDALTLEGKPHGIVWNAANFPGEYFLCGKLVALGIRWISLFGAGAFGAGKFVNRGFGILGINV